MVRHISMSWCWRSLVPARFPPYPTPCDTNGPAGSARWPFFEWASAAFRDGEWCGSGSGELPEDSSSSVGRSTSSGSTTSFLLPGREGGSGREVLAIARLGRPLIGFTDAHFLPATGSLVRAVRPSTWHAPLVLLPSLGARGGTSLRGLSSLDFQSWR